MGIPSDVEQNHYTYLIVDQSPLLQEGMYSDNSAHISCQISPARSNGQVFGRVEAVRVDHKVAIVLVHCWSLATVLEIEKL